MNPLTRLAMLSQIIITLLASAFTFNAVAQVAAPPAPPAREVKASSPMASSTQTSETMGRSTRTVYQGAKEIHWVRDSAEYRGCALQAFAWAGRLVEEKAKTETSGTWAVVCDADETVLDNSEFQKEVGSEGYTPENWNAWVQRQEAAAIPGAIAFLNHVHELGGKIVIVTNRKGNECPPTQENFRKAGLPFDIMLCQMSADKIKDGRFESVENGTAAQGVPPMKVLLYCGDNIQDFPKQRQEIRLQPEEAMKDFGQKFIVIPNPMYGTWVENPER